MDFLLQPSANKSAAKIKKTLQLLKKVVDGSNPAFMIHFWNVVLRRSAAARTLYLWPPSCQQALGRGTIPLSEVEDPLGTPTGLTTFYVLFFIHLQTRRIVLGGTTCWPHEVWMKQIARNLTGEDGLIHHARFLLHDRDTKYSEGFDAVFIAAGIKPLKLPPQSPNLNAFAERWVRSVKEECLHQMILFGERSLRHVLSEYLAHYHHERNHQGLDNVIPFPDPRAGCRETGIRKSERLGGLLNFYHRAA